MFPFEATSTPSFHNCPLPAASTVHSQCAATFNSMPANPKKALSFSPSRNTRKLKVLSLDNTRKYLVLPCPEYPKSTIRENFRRSSKRAEKEILQASFVPPKVAPQRSVMSSKSAFPL